MCDQSGAETSNRQNTTLTRDRKPYSGGIRTAIAASTLDRLVTANCTVMARSLRIVLSWLGRTVTVAVKGNKVISTIFLQKMQTIVI
jgi:hypothetical protein